MSRHEGYGDSVIPDEKNTDLGDFAPKGSSPKMLGRGRATKDQGEGQGSVSDSEAMAALREFSPLKMGPSYSSLDVSEEGIDVPSENAATSLYNRKT